MSSFFNNNKKNKNPFSFNNNNTSFNNFQSQQSNGYDNTDRPLGYKPRLIPLNEPPKTLPVNNNPVNNTQNNNNPNPQNSAQFGFNKPNTAYTPPTPTGQNLPQGYEQEFFTYHYPTTGEIVKDLGLRVFEVVVGAAAVAAGQEVARFFSRRRFEPHIRDIIYDEQQHYNNYNNKNTWGKK